MKIEDAVSRTIDECISEGIIADFLGQHRAEVQEMSVLEYNEELHLKNVHRDGYDEGHIDGYDEAKAEDKAIIAEKDAQIAELEKKIKLLESQVRQ